jgi:hypothetical protein
MSYAAFFLPARFFTAEPARFTAHRRFIASAVMSGFSETWWTTSDCGAGIPEALRQRPPVTCAGGIDLGTWILTL